MREVEFKMERQGLVNINDEVEIIERSSPSNYHYIIEPAVAMSGCFSIGERILSRKGIVKDIRHSDRGYYVIVDFDE